MCSNKICMIKTFLCNFIFQFFANEVEPFSWECTIRTLQITVILITGKTRIFLICTPCQDKNGAGSGISLVNLWFLYNSEQWPGQHHDLSCSRNHSPFHNSLVLLHSLTLLTAYMGQGLVTRVYWHKPSLVNQRCVHLLRLRTSRWLCVWSAEGHWKGLYLPCLFVI